MPKRLVTDLPVKELTVAEGNYYAGRDNSEITHIVLHTIVGTIKSADGRFNNPVSKVSANYGIDENGDIYHWVDETNTAYANGNWQMNLHAISIEHADHGDYNGVRPDALYSSSAKLVTNLCKFYNLPCDRSHVIGHREVPSPTDCPDGLDLNRIVKEAQEIINTPVPEDPQVYDERKAIENLYAALNNLKKADNTPLGGNLEGLTNLLIQDAYPAYLKEQVAKIQTVSNPQTPVSPAPEVLNSPTPEVLPVEQPKHNALEDLFDQIRKLFHLKAS